MLKNNLILEHWFGEIELTEAYYSQKIPWWFFGRNPELDEYCFHALQQRSQFKEEELVMSQVPKEALLQILLFDQFPRNAFRDDPRAHDWDEIALKFSLAAIEKKIDQKLSLPERIFIYMPLEHSENQKHQDLSVDKFYELHREAPKEIKKWTRLGLEKALDHQATIRKFGRFPSRNEKLGRSYTPAEMKFLGINV